MQNKKNNQQYVRRMLWYLRAKGEYKLRTWYIHFKWTARVCACAIFSFPHTLLISAWFRCTRENLDLLVDFGMTFVMYIQFLFLDDDNNEKKTLESNRNHHHHHSHASVFKEFTEKKREFGEIYIPRQTAIDTTTISLSLSHSLTQSFAQSIINKMYKWYAIVLKYLQWFLSFHLLGPFTWYCCCARLFICRIEKSWHMLCK